MDSPGLILENPTIGGIHLPLSQGGDLLLEYSAVLPDSCSYRLCLFVSCGAIRSARTVHRGRVLKNCPIKITLLRTVSERSDYT